MLARHPRRSPGSWPRPSTATVGLARIQPGGGSEIDVHPHSEQVFYVLQGTFSLRNAEQGEIRRRRPGQAVYVAPGEPHAAGNPGTEEAVCLVVTAPPLG